jgi:hypothetical protein
MMKKLLFLAAMILATACSSDDGSIDVEEIQLFVNHFKTTAPFTLDTVLLIQEEENIGSDVYLSTFGIRDFEFEQGYTYLLTVERTVRRNPETDYSTVSYKLISIDEKTAVAENTTFTVPLARFTFNTTYLTMITGALDFGYFISNQIPIECPGGCGVLRSVVENRQRASGVFTHGPDGTYILQEVY